MRIVKLDKEIIDYGVELIHPEAEWNVTRGEGINVAILDTGIDYKHEDLTIAGGINCTGGDTNDFMDRNGHGTFCAGIIGANENQKGIVGLAPKSNIYAVKVLNDKSQGTITWLLDGINWCIEHNIDVINMSLGFVMDSIDLHLVVKQAYDAGIIMVAAAGNDNKSINADFPARYDEVLCVTAIDKNQRLASFDTTGSKIELSAPGVDITSTFLNNQYAIGSGTSFATPHIVGAITLIQSYYLKQGKKLTMPELRKFLFEHTIDLGDVGRDNQYGFGMFKFV